MRTPSLTAAVVGAALVACLTGIGVAAAVDSTGRAGETVVVNKNGHEVDEHAAYGQERAAEARSKRDRPAPGAGHGHAFGHLSPEEKATAKAAMKALKRAGKKPEKQSGDRD